MKKKTNPSKPIATHPRLGEIKPKQKLAFPRAAALGQVFEVVEYGHINSFDRSKAIGFHITMTNGGKVVTNSKALGEFIMRAINAYQGE